MQWVSELNDNDVLLGREAVALKGEGHRRFQLLIDEHVEEYNATRRHAVKREIANRIKDTIRFRGGRFMRRIESLAEKLSVGASASTDVFVLVGEESISQKIKQALRDKSRYDPEQERFGEGKLIPADQVTSEASCEASNSTAHREQSTEVDTGKNHHAHRKRRLSQDPAPSSNLPLPPGSRELPIPAIGPWVPPACSVEVGQTGNEKTYDTESQATALTLISLHARACTSAAAVTESSREQSSAVAPYPLVALKAEEPEQATPPRKTSTK